MPSQIFTAQEITVFQQAAQKLAANPAFAASRQNMTKAEQKANDAAMLTAQINQIQASIDNIDARYVALKASELDSLTTSLSFYTDLKTKVLNTPE